MSHAPAARPETGRFAVGCLIALGIGLLVAVGGGYAMFQYGVGLIEDEVREDLADHPVVREHLGELQSVELDLETSAELEGDEQFAFRAVGTKGGGVLRITVVTGEDDKEHVTAGTLEVDGGQTVDLFPEPDAIEPEPDEPSTEPSPDTPSDG